MYSYYYYLNKNEADKQYSEIFNNIGCDKGSREYLLNVVKNNKLFCRDQRGIDHDYFIQSMEKDNIIIYITDDKKKLILGACSLYNSHIITIHSICVPKDNDDVILKGIGTLLLNKIKELAYKLNVKRILVSVNNNVKKFYEKNGFTELDLNNNGISNNNSDSIEMNFNVNVEGGRRRIKTNKKRKTKQRNKKTKKFKRGRTN